MNTDILPTPEWYQSLTGEEHQTPTDPVAVPDEDYLEHHQRNLLELSRVAPVVGLVQSGLNALGVSALHVSGDEVNVTRGQGL